MGIKILFIGVVVFAGWTGLGALLTGFRIGSMTPMIPIILTDIILVVGALWLLLSSKE